MQRSKEKVERKSRVKEQQKDKIKWKNAEIVNNRKGMYVSDTISVII